MANLVKAELSARVKRNNMIKLTLVATIAVIGILMAVVSVINGKYLFAVAYLLAAVLGVLYTIIKINATLPPYAACDGEKLYMNTWNNCFFPYNLDFKPKFFADFVPARIVTFELPLDEIDDMAIGTKGYLSRTLKNEKLDSRFAAIAAKNRRLATELKRLDILYVRLKSGRIYMMSVSDFDVESLYHLVDMIEHRTQGLEFKTNVRLLRRKRETIEGRQRI